MITWLFKLKWSELKEEWRLSRIRLGKTDPDFILEFPQGKDLPDCENIDRYFGEGKELDKSKVYYFPMTKGDFLTKEELLLYPNLEENHNDTNVSK